jgi:CheY-like chemotaxis protein
MDDEEMVRELTAETLKRLGYETMAVRDGEKAITAYRAAMDTDAPFDVVLLDLTVKGGMGGKEAMAELRRIDSGVKAIVCSGYFEDGGMGAYAAWGFRAAIAKPYKATELADLLEEVLGEADQR